MNDFIENEELTKETVVSLEPYEKNRATPKETVVSFDVGIKNLAVFVGQYSPETNVMKTTTTEENTKEKELGFIPLFWKVINILGEDTHKCCICNKKAILSINVNSLNEILENKETNISWYCKTHDPYKKSRTKEEYNKLLLKRDGKKVLSCGTQELQIKMIKGLENCVKEYFDLLDADTVIIELQPKLNPKMKQLSHTLYTWFLIRGVLNEDKKMKTVKFIPAKNKLKIAHRFCPLLETDETKIKRKYNQRKYLAQQYTKEIIHKYFSFSDIYKKFINIYENSSKKDDLCDCFLQCLYFIHTQNISYEKKEIRLQKQKNKKLKQKLKQKKSK